MTLSLNGWKKEDLLNLPRREWSEESTYDSILILPTGETHDSGWQMMAIIGVRKAVPIEIASGCCDDIEWILPPAKSVSTFKVGRMRNDCLLTSGALQMWSRDCEFMVGTALSSTTIELKLKES